MKSDLSIEDIIRLYQDKVYNTCLGFLKNEEEAEDIAQEIFIKVYKNLDRFQGNSSLSTWIYRITVNQCLEELRKTKHIRKLVNVEESHHSSIGVMQRSDFYHPGVSLENRERAHILFEAIDRLPEQQKVAFTLHKMEGLPYAEIGKIMKKSLSSVESLMHRAKSNLQNILRDYYEGK